MVTAVATPSICGANSRSIVAADGSPRGAYLRSGVRNSTNCEACWWRSRSS